MPMKPLRFPINFVTIGSIGTYGHLAMASEFGRICRTLRPDLCVRLLNEGNGVPPFFQKYLDSVTLLNVRPQLCSRGGRLNATYSCEEIHGIIDWTNPGVWIFSSFYDANLIRAITRAGGRCIWMGNPMRRSFWELFHIDGSQDLFDEIVVLDDIGTFEALGHQTEQASVTLLPPPYYVRASTTLGPIEREIIGLTLAVSCGGGLVNGSDALLETSIRSLRTALSDDVRVLIFPGDVVVKETPEYGSNLKIIQGALTEHLLTCDLVICQAGYHTVHELLYFGTPGVLIPAPRLIDDQELRAVSVSRATGMPILLPSELERLSKVVIDLLHRKEETLWNIRNQIAVTVTARSWRTKANMAWSKFLNRLRPT